MTFHNDTLRDDVSYRARFGPGWNTTILSSPGGDEERLSRWEQFRVQGSVSFSDLESWAEVASVRDFAISKRGAAHSFRMRDWTDYASTSTGTTHQKGDPTITPTDQLIGTGDGATTQFQLRKTYRVGTLYERIRNVTMPIESTVRVAFDGVEQLAGWSVNDVTGLLTFTVAPAIGVLVQAGFEHDIQARFDEGVDELLEVTVQAFDDNRIADVGFVEVRDRLEVPTGRSPGGSQPWTNMLADVQMSIAQGQLHDLDVNAAGLTAFLPDITEVPTGSDLLTTVNSGGFSVDVTPFGGSTPAITVSVGDVAKFHVTKDAAGVKSWVAHA